MRRTFRYLVTVLISFLLDTGLVSSVQLHAGFHRGLLQSDLLISSGLQDGTTLGHYLVGDGLKRSTIYNGITQYGGLKSSTSGSWGQNFLYSGTKTDSGLNPDITEATGTDSGVTIGNVNFVQESLYWMTDTVGRYVYKVDTSNSATSAGTVTGVYHSRPSRAFLCPPLVFAHGARVCKYFYAELTSLIVAVCSCKAYKGSRLASVAWAISLQTD